MNIASIATLLGPICLADVTQGQKIVEWINARLPTGTVCVITMSGDELKLFIAALPQDVQTKLLWDTVLTIDEIGTLSDDVRVAQSPPLSRQDQWFGFIMCLIAVVMALIACAVFAYFIKESAQVNQQVDTSVLTEVVKTIAAPPAGSQ